ncbi:hypothetical protein [Jiangella sp. DSM 45060]|uniref:hypothetical protein n=1 Tax=Jiangella sp. DSM 45060 TaxID=1798224 RepID=UPI000B893F85|nr:hypothetical protein [Jiangella sp. DSM 45060]
MSPTEALLDEVRWTAGHCAWLRARVQEVEQRNLAVGVTEQKIDPAGGKTVTIKSVPNVWLDLYDRERKHLVAVCAAAIRAGVEERRVQLEERQGALIGDVIGRILDALDLSEAQQARVPEALRAQVQVLAGGKAAA